MADQVRRFEATFAGSLTVTLDKTNPEAEGPDQLEAAVHWQAHVLEVGQTATCHATTSLGLPTGQVAPGASRFALTDVSHLVGMISVSQGKSIQAESGHRRALADLIRGGSFQVWGPEAPRPHPAKDLERVVSHRAQSVLAASLLPAVNGSLAAMGIRPRTSGANGTKIQG